MAAVRSGRPAEVLRWDRPAGHSACWRRPVVGATGVAGAGGAAAVDGGEAAVVGTGGAGSGSALAVAGTATVTRLALAIAAIASAANRPLRRVKLGST